MKRFRAIRYITVILALTAGFTFTFNASGPAAAKYTSVFPEEDVFYITSSDGYLFSDFTGDSGRFKNTTNAYAQWTIKKGWWAIYLKGGKGGNGDNQNGGLGGTVCGMRYFPQDTTVYAIVACGGASGGSSTAYYGGGRGNSGDGGSGGGCTILTTSLTFTEADHSAIIAIAGGGGGGAEWSNENVVARQGFAGGEGGSIGVPATTYNPSNVGAAVGPGISFGQGQQGYGDAFGQTSERANGGGYSTASVSESGGGGGNATTKGGVRGNEGYSNPGSPGAFLTGGNGSTTGTNPCTGGGGAGWYGGGGGGTDGRSNRDGAGGGGSSYAVDLYALNLLGAGYPTVYQALQDSVAGNAWDGKAVMLYLGLDYSGPGFP